MASIDQRPARLDMYCAVGDDFTATFTVTENSSPWVSTGATITSAILNQAGTVQATNFTTSASTGSLTLSLTDTQTTTLGAGQYRYWVAVTKSSLTRTWIAGTFTVAAASGTGTSSTSATLSVTTSTVTLSLASLVAPAAANITVTDSGGYYTGTNVEDVLAEQGLQRARDLLFPVVPRPIKVMSSPPTVGALTTSTGIASSVSYKVSSGGSTSVNTAFFTTVVGTNWTRFGDTFPNYDYATQVQPSVGGGSIYGSVEFEFYGLTFEVLARGSGGYIRLWVDGELVSATPTNFPANGNTYFLPVTFASLAVRRIRIDMYNMQFGGVAVGPNDTVHAVDVRRPKCLLIGDSFIEGTGSNNVDGFAANLSAHLDWDVWAAGQGGSGYSAPGSYTGKYSTRIGFYSSIDFDVIITSGGINDANSTYISSLATDAASLFTTIKSTWPTAVWIATSPLVPRGVEGWAAEWHTARATLESAASAAGFYFADIMQIPVTGSTLQSGTLSSTANSGTTTISSATRFSVRSTIEIGTGLSTVERRVVTATSGSGPYAHTVAALTSTHNSGETVKQVGNALMTGTGRVGATTGSGNADIFTSSDATHPTAAGHAALAKALADQIASVLQPY